MITEYYTANHPSPLVVLHGSKMLYFKDRPEIGWLEKNNLDFGMDMIIDALLLRHPDMDFKLTPYYHDHMRMTFNANRFTKEIGLYTFRWEYSMKSVLKIQRCMKKKAMAKALARRPFSKANAFRRASTLPSEIADEVALRSCEGSKNNKAMAFSIRRVETLSYRQN